MPWLMNGELVSLADSMVVGKLKKCKHLPSMALDLLLDPRPPSPPPKRHEGNFSTMASDDTSTWTATRTITNARVAEAELVSALRVVKSLSTSLLSAERSRNATYTVKANYYAVCLPFSISLPFTDFPEDDSIPFWHWTCVHLMYKAQESLDEKTSLVSHCLAAL